MGYMNRLFSSGGKQNTIQLALQPVFVCHTFEVTSVWEFDKCCLYVIGPTHAALDSTNPLELKHFLSRSFYES